MEHLGTTVSTGTQLFNKSLWLTPLHSTLCCLASSANFRDALLHLISSTFFHDPEKPLGVFPKCQTLHDSLCSNFRKCFFRLLSSAGSMPSATLHSQTSLSNPARHSLPSSLMGWVPRSLASCCQILSISPWVSLTQLKASSSSSHFCPLLSLLLQNFTLEARLSFRASCSLFSQQYSYQPRSNSACSRTI